MKCSRISSQKKNNSRDHVDKMLRTPKAFREWEPMLYIDDVAHMTKRNVWENHPFRGSFAEDMLYAADFAACRLPYRYALQHAGVSFTYTGRRLCLLAGIPGRHGPVGKLEQAASSGTYGMQAHSIAGGSIV